MTDLELVLAAVDLLSEDGENPEYDRALAELLADTVLAVPEQDLGTTAATVARLLRAMKDIMLGRGVRSEEDAT